MRRSAASSASRSVRPLPCRGRKPSNTNRPVGQAAGHQRGDRGRRPGHDLDARGRRRARPAPGARPGRRCRACRRRSPPRPARPRARRSSTLADAARLGVVVDDDERPARDAGVLEQAARCGGCPRSRSRRRRGSASTARGERSPRLPIGVPDRARAVIGRRRCSSRSSSWSPAARPQRANAPASASSTAWACEHGPARRRRRGSAGRAQHDEVAGRRSATSIGEAHAERVHRPGRPEQQRAVDAVAAEQAPPARRRVVGHLEAGQHLPVPEQPGHAELPVRR